MMIVKIFQKQQYYHHRTPYRPIDINKVKRRLSGAREDDEDFNMILSDEDDDNNKENNDEIIKPKRQGRKKTKK